MARFSDAPAPDPGSLSARAMLRRRALPVFRRLPNHRIPKPPPALPTIRPRTARSAVQIVFGAIRRRCRQWGRIEPCGRGAAMPLSMAIPPAADGWKELHGLDAALQQCHHLRRRIDPGQQRQILCFGSIEKGRVKPGETPNRAPACFAARMSEASTTSRRQRHRLRCLTWREWHPARSRVRKVTSSAGRPPATSAFAPVAGPVLTSVDGQHRNDRRKLADIARIHE
jgi:hypothetical protein